MLGRKERDQLELFVAGSLRDLLPEDHVLIGVDRVLDLSWLRAEVVDLYCQDNGRPGIDPEIAVRLMLAGFLHGIVQDRRLMRGEACPATGSRGGPKQVNLAIRWFIGYGLHEALPDHSSLTRIRQRWGEAVFRTVFTRVVRQCQAAGLVSAETVHVDASMIPAASANGWVDAMAATLGARAPSRSRRMRPMERVTSMRPWKNVKSDTSFRTANRCAARIPVASPSSASNTMPTRMWCVVRTGKS